MASLIGQPHYELVENYGFHETLIGRYLTEEQANSERDLRLRVWGKLRLSHGTLIVRKREF